MMQQIPYKSLSLLAVRQQLGQQISLIFMSVHISCPPFVSCRTFSHEMVCNTLRIGNGGIGKYRSVVSMHIRRSSHWNSHHSKLIAQTSKIFTAFFHSNEFRAKRGCFNTCLLLTPPMDQSTVQIYKETSPRSSSHGVSTMAGINFCSDTESNFSGLRCIWRQLLFTINMTKFSSGPIAPFKSPTH